MKFNLKRQNRNVTRNHEGARAYRMSPEMELYTAVVTSSLSDKFYETGKQRIERIRELIRQADPRFVARLAVYAREYMNLRSVPLALVVELAAVHNGDQLVSRTVERVVRRADEITELLACYAVANDRQGYKKLNRVSAQVRKGLANAFNRFDEYQFAKYDRKAAITLKDALFLVHPKAQDEAQQTIFDKIANGKLETAYTWETELSRKGKENFSNAEDKRQAFGESWEQLVKSGKMGYMALLRNLRNMLESGVKGEALDAVADRLRDPVAVRRSRQFPFRFLSAYRELQKISASQTGILLAALEDAAKASAENIRAFRKTDNVLIAVDMSGSMQTAVSSHSTVMNYEVGLILAMLLETRCRNVLTGIFGSEYKRIALPKGNVLSNAYGLASRIGEVGHATNGHLVIEDLIQTRTVVDKVVIFTDMQLYNNRIFGVNSLEGVWKRYKKMAPGARLYLVDLAGYGQTPLRIESEDVFLVAGWSEKVFEAIAMIEHGEHALSVISEIRI